MADITQLVLSYPDFVLGQVIDPAQFDQNNTEIVAKINEVVTLANTHTADIATVDTLADTAVATANTASTNATSAVNTANGADTKSDSAVSTANTASANASSAVATANTAKTTADGVKTEYDALKPTLEQAVVDANAAVEAVADKVDKSYVDNLAADFVLGIIPDASLTAAKLAFDVATQAELDAVSGNITGLAGTGRTTETVKANADAIASLAGTGRTTETVKQNADDIAGHLDEVASQDTFGHIKVGNGLSIDESGFLSNISQLWTTVDSFARASDSSYTVTDNATNQAIHAVGRPIRYADTAGTYSYGIITGYTTGTVTLAGASMTTSFDAILEYGDFTRVVPLEVIIPSTFASAGASSTLINTVLKADLAWRMSKAYLVRFLHIVDTDDTGANQTRVNVNVAGSPVGTANSNAGPAIAESWVATTTDINTSNYDINFGEAIEVTCDANGTNDNATNLTVSMTFVLA